MKLFTSTLLFLLLTLNLFAQSAPVIVIETPLPAITDTVEIDGKSQIGSYRVNIDGSQVADTTDGLQIIGADSVIIRALSVYNFKGSGIYLKNSRNHIYENNWLGFDGSIFAGNGYAGMFIDDSVSNITLGQKDKDFQNLFYDGLVIQGENTSEITALSNRYFLKDSVVNSGDLRLPIDIDNRGPSCVEWNITDDINSKKVPSPRILSITEDEISGISKPNSTIIYFESRDIGTNGARYWPQSLYPEGFTTSDENGLFTFQNGSSPGLMLSFVAVDENGNTSEPTQLRKPLIIVPGIGGTWLRYNDDDYWLPDLVETSESFNNYLNGLALSEDGITSVLPLIANEVIENVYGSVNVYGELFKAFEEDGYNGHKNNHNVEGLDLWRFPNDWRRSTSILADSLRLFIDKLTTNSGGENAPARSCLVDLIGHSNGGMISSVYVMRDSVHSTNKVNHLLTSGTPYLGADKALAAHSNGYIFDAEKNVGSGKTIQWGEMLSMTRNVPGAYGLLPSKAYYEAMNPNSQSYIHGYTFVNLFNEGLTTYQQIFDFFANPKLTEIDIPFGLARNVSIFQNQQEVVHDVMNDWRDYHRPPFISRQVGYLPASTPTGWGMAPGPEFIPAGYTTRSEDGDASRHRAFRERLSPKLKLGDGTVPLLSATLGRNTEVGDTDFSGVEESPWIQEFEYYKCDHLGLAADDCKPLNEGDSYAIPRMIEIIKGSYEVPGTLGYVDSAPVEKVIVSNNAVNATSTAELFNINSNVPIQVLIEDSFGNKTGISDPTNPEAVEYAIENITYYNTALGANFTLRPNENYTITVNTNSEEAKIYLSRLQYRSSEIGQIIFPDQQLISGQSLIFEYDPSSDLGVSPWKLDTNGDGISDSEILPALSLTSNQAGIPLPLPMPIAIETTLPIDQDSVIKSIIIPSTGSNGWTYSLSDIPNWFSISDTSGTVPDTIAVKFFPQEMNQESYEHTMQLTISNGGYSSSFDLPVIAILSGDVVSIENEMPLEFSLSQNYPNPFNPSTIIKYQLPKTTKVQLMVFDMLGREVAVLVNESQNAGYQQVTFDAKNLASGMYIYRLKAGDAILTKKLIFIK